ncbi:MAG: putative toxin-antitoxin system toxin component, PIN family [Deltaproteobacteria bacterium]|nr:putative toxin-antitoxin system toxin component, PIN family [Deltaproteobacteria bacterium]
MARRVVLDTNILISGYLWKGLPRQAIEKVRHKEWTLLVSKDTVAELIRVLAYRKFGLSPEEIHPIVEDLLQISETVEVTTKVAASKLISLTICS